MAARDPSAPSYCTIISANSRRRHCSLEFVVRPSGSPSLADVNAVTHKSCRLGKSASTTTTTTKTRKLVTHSPFAQRGCLEFLSLLASGHHTRPHQSACNHLLSLYWLLFEIRARELAIFSSRGHDESSRWQVQVATACHLMLSLPSSSTWSSSCFALVVLVVVV